MNPGVYLDMDRAQYDLLPHHNQSRLKKWIELGDIPSEFRYYQDHRHEEESGDYLVLGTGLDCSLLEPDKFSLRFLQVPECDRRTKVGKEIWESFTEAKNGRTLLKQDQAQRIAFMHDAVLKNESTRDVLANCKKAVLVANIFDFPCKGEVDLWESISEHMWDLKALKDVSPKGFAKAFFDFGYDIQATFYLALAKTLNFDKRVFNFVCVKNVAPFTVKVHSFSPCESEEHAAIELHAIKRIERAIHELDRRLKANDFKDDTDWRLIDIPAWRLRQAQFESEVA